MTTERPWAAWREAAEKAKLLHVSELPLSTASRPSRHRSPFEGCPEPSCVLARAVAALLPCVEAAEQAQRWEHRCSDKVGGCTAVSASDLEALDATLAAAQAVAEGGTGC